MKLFNEGTDLSSVILLAVGILEGIHYLYYIFEPITASKIGKYMSWRKFDKLIKKIADQIKKDNKRYAMIVAAGRGGAICAGCLSSYLESIPVLVLDRKYLDGGGTRKATFYESKVVIDERFQLLKNEKILLLSQQSDPGITLSEIEKVMANSGFSYMDQCAVLKSDKTADTDIKYFAQSYSSNKKCKKFPWEKHKGYMDIMN